MAEEPPSSKLETKWAEKFLGWLQLSASNVRQGKVNFYVVFSTVRDAALFFDFVFLFHLLHANSAWLSGGWDGLHRGGGKKRCFGWGYNVDVHLCRMSCRACDSVAGHTKHNRAGTLSQARCSSWQAWARRICSWYPGLLLLWSYPAAVSPITRGGIVRQMRRWWLHLCYNLCPGFLLALSVVSHFL